MNSETKNCQNCKKDFNIEPDDFLFYEKINVPPPTFCPDCRRMWRWVWRNERTYYKRKCNVPGHTEDIISIYSPDKEHIIYDQEYWKSDNWDPLSYGQDYDFSKPFFQQYIELLDRVPFIAMSNTNPINSDYCSSAAYNKNCYLVNAGGWNEDTMYANRPIKNKNSMDLYIVDNSELCYDVLYCHKCYKVLFSYNCSECSDSMFLYNCRNCQDCFGCTNLRGKSHCFFNEQLSKEEYNKKIQELDLGSWENLKLLKEYFYNNIYLQTIHKFSDQINCYNSTGDHLQNTKNCKECYDFSGDSAEDCKYVDWSGFVAKDLYDCGPGAGWKSELLYQCLDVNESSNIFAGLVCYYSTDIKYSVYIQSSNNIFGCYGLRSKQYCILNKQYTKEEYEELLPKIIKQMDSIPFIDSLGRVYKYGEFFPNEISPFAYNETVAQEYSPLDKKMAITQGFRWQDQEKRNYKIDISNTDIPDNIVDIDDSILNKIIECEHKGNCTEKCTEAFKIIPEELNFYKRMNLPLPRLCPNCRHYQRLNKRNPMKLWHRSCMCKQDTHEHKGNCEVEFETSYAPDRPEIIYCEKCYQQEVI